MSDLHKTLAARLFDVVQTARHTHPAPGTLYADAQLTEYAALADECIRQMEWTMRGVAAPQAWRELTPAPDDWKPE